MNTRIYIKAEIDELMKPTTGVVVSILPDTEQNKEFRPPEFFSILVEGVSPRQLKSTIFKTVDVKKYYEERCECCGSGELFMTQEQFSRGVID